MTDLTPTHEMLENEVESKSMGLASTVTLPSRNSEGNTDRGRMQPTTALANKNQGHEHCFSRRILSYHWSVM
jgi:hypothetical protein